MAKDPAVLFYTNDFIVGTLTMTDEQRGKYIMLLCLQHQKGYLTEKDMLKICQTHDPDIWEKFDENEGQFRNRRMMIESEKRTKYSESRRANRNTKNVPGESDNISETYVEHMENENENENDNENENENENDNTKQKEKSKNDFLDQIIQAFVDVYGDYEIISRGKERMATAKLLGIYKKKYPRATSEETIAGLKSYFEACVAIPDDWLRTNMSIPIIVSQFNKINQILKHGNKKMGATTDLQLAEIVAKHFAND